MAVRPTLHQDADAMDVEDPGQAPPAAAANTAAILARQTRQRLAGQTQGEAARHADDDPMPQAPPDVPLHTLFQPNASPG